MLRTREELRAPVMGRELATTCSLLNPATARRPRSSSELPMSRPLENMDVKFCP